MPDYRSKTSTHGRNMAGARALWRATGMKDADFKKPIIAIANSFTQFVPGHVHLKDMGQLVAREIERAGGVAKEFNTIAVDDGIAMGHDGMLYSLETEPPLARDAWATLAQRADAIVVLGSGRERGDPAWGSDQPTGIGLERQRYAARLAKASGLPVLTTGGLHYGSPPSEAQLMADSLRDDFGVQVRWKEEQSRTTWENAQMTAGILLPLGIKRVVVVTHGWHMPRSVWSFEQAGFEVVPAAVGFFSADNARPLGGWMPEYKAFWQSGLLINEAVGQMAYPLFYR